MRKIKIASITLITSLFLLTACGQKGALYIPADPTAETAPEKTEKSDKKETKNKSAE